MKQSTRSVLSRLSFAILSVFISGLVIAPAASEPPQAVRSGPIPIRDQHPLSFYHASFSPESPGVLEAGEFRARTAFNWSNTLNNRRGSYRIDAETRLVEFGLRYSPYARLELGIGVPLLWRGEGVADSTIDNWHQAFGFPRADRDIVPDNEFALRGDNQDGTRFNLTPQGTRVMNLVLDAKYEIIPRTKDASQWSALIRLGIPVPQNAYTQQGIDLGATLLGQMSPEVTNLDWLTLYFGAGYMHFTDEETDGLAFKHNHFFSFLQFETEPFGSIPVLLGLVYQSPLVNDVEKFPDYAVYLDLGTRFGLTDRTYGELLLRENISSQDGTADITVMFALSVSGN